MKLISSILLAFSASANAFVIQPLNNPTASTTSLKDVGLQWGFDERGCRKEYYLEHWSDRSNDCPESQWAYDRPWSGVSQTLFIPRHQNVIDEFQREFESKAILGSRAKPINVQAAPPQQAAAPLPPSEPAQPMPDTQGAVSPQYAAQKMIN